jgi:tRNA pseudouridine38-40 synthase
MSFLHPLFMRVALSLEYDGCGFCGWQRQPSGCSIQNALERALSTIAAEPIAVHCAGRTDAGVHALSQVVHFDTSAKRNESAWVRGVNSELPRTIAVQWAREVSESFHARSQATGRVYAYCLLNRAERPGVHAGRIGWYHRHLDVERMRAAAQPLLGTHDFSAFRAAECEAHTPVKNLRRLGIERFGELIVFEFAADAFLHHMVRNIVGSLLKVGDGTRAVRWITQVLESRDRTRAAATFHPDGLYLTAVEYDPAWGLPALPARIPFDLCSRAGLV